MGEEGRNGKKDAGVRIGEGKGEGGIGREEGKGMEGKDGERPGPPMYVTY